jgi:CBS-domain-containing membrane protein
MQAKEIMTREVVTVRPGTAIHEAAALLIEHRVASLPVLDDDGRVIGMLSEADLSRNRMPPDSRSHLRVPRPEQGDPPDSVGAARSAVAICLGANADAADLAALRLDNNLRAIPITDGPRRLTEYTARAEHWQIVVQDGVVSVAGRFDEPDQQAVVVSITRPSPESSGCTPRRVATTTPTHTMSI